MASNKPMDLLANGNPSQPIVNQQPNLPDALNFAPAPAQPVASETLGLLGALAGLGLNIAGAVQGKGRAPGQGVTQWSQQQIGQANENQKQSQRTKEEEAEAEALVKRAKSAGLSGNALGQITTLAQNRQVAAGRQELDRELSLIRQREKQAKEEKAYTTAEAMQGLRNVNDTLKSHPGAVESFLADFSDKVKDSDKPGNLQARLQTEARKAGITMNSASAKKYAQDLSAARDEAMASRKTGGLFGMFQSDAPVEEHKSVRQVLESRLDADSIADYKNLSGTREQLKQAVALLRSKPNSTNYQKGVEMLQQLQAGNAPQTAAAPAAAAPQDPRIAALIENAKKGDAKAAAFLKSKNISH